MEYKIPNASKIDKLPFIWAKVIRLTAPHRAYLEPAEGFGRHILNEARASLEGMNLWKNLTGYMKLKNKIS